MPDDEHDHEPPMMAIACAYCTPLHLPGLEVAHDCPCHHGSLPYMAPSEIVLEPQVFSEATLAIRPHCRFMQTSTMFKAHWLPETRYQGLSLTMVLGYN